MAIPLAWQLSMQGADAIKQEFRDIQNELQKTGHWTEDLAKRQRTLEQASRIQVQTGTRMRNMYLATHPVLNNFTRAMSVFNSVLHAVSTAMLLINTANINRNLAEQAKFTADLAQIEREIALQRQKNIPNDKKLLELEDQRNIILAEQKEALQRNKEANDAMVISMVVGMAQIATAVAVSVPKIIPLLTALSVASWASLGPWGLIAAGIALVGVAAYELGNALGLNKISLDGISFWWYTQGEPALSSMVSFFTNVIPSAVTAGVNFMGKMITDGINFIVGNIIKFVNDIISKINSVAKKLKLPTLPSLTFTPLTFTPIGAQQGPTQSQSGIIPATHPWLGNTGGGQVVNNVRVEGSIWSKEEFNRAVGEALKSQLLQRGFQ